MEIENLVIIGSGPSGYTAALYAAREDLKPLMISGFPKGGQLMLTTVVDNYPGFPDGVMGPDLMELMRKQAEKFGTRFIDDNVTSVDLKKSPFEVTVGDKTYYARTVIVSTGASSNWMGLESEKRLIGRGVSSCATCMPPGSLIVTNPSIADITSVSAQTMVLTHDGTFNPVSELMERDYEGELINFKTRFFRSETTSLTPNHPVLVRTLTRHVGKNYRKREWSEPFWITADELTKDHILLYPIPRTELKLKSITISEKLSLKTENGYVRLDNESSSSHRIKDTVEINSDFCRLIGYYLSEGFSHSRGVSFAFNTNETEYVNDCVSLLHNIFGLDVSTKTENHVIRISVWSMILSKFFESLFGKYSHSKKLPHEFILIDRDLQKEIVKGLWRGDGCDRKTDFVITTSSRELSEQIKMILLRLGILPTLEKRNPKTFRHSIIEGRKVEFKKDVYQLLVGGPWLEQMSKILDFDHPRLHSRKHFCNHGWIDDTYAMLAISELKRVQYSGKVFNIAVEGNNTYVTTNSIVHNCDAFFMKNKEVVVVGGGDSAMEEALFLTKFASSVTLVHRKDTFRASKIMQEKVMQNPKIKILWNCMVDEVLGKDKVEGVRLSDVKTGAKADMKVDGVFVAIGHSPNTSFLGGQLELDQKGYIITTDEVKTAIPGVFAAGDVVDHVYRQAVTAAGSGAKAAMEARSYLYQVKLV